MRAIRTFACLAAVTAIAPAALAQEAAPAATTTTTTTATTTTAATTPPPYVAPTTAPEARGEDEMRFRWGISGFGGRYFVNETGGGIGGLDLRLGAQINRMIGVYGSPILLIGGGATASAGPNSASTDVSLVALYGVGALVDFTFSDMFFVAIGPELLRGAAAQAATKADSTNTSTSASAESGTFFGIEARAGLALGSMKPNRRKAFTIGVDLHTIFTEKMTVVPLLALGYDAF